MKEFSSSKRRLRLAVRGQIILRADAGDELATIAMEMVKAWRLYTKQRFRLRARLSPADFFSEGHWRNSHGWHWDKEELLKERQHADERAGGGH